MLKMPPCLSVERDALWYSYLCTPRIIYLFITYNDGKPCRFIYLFIYLSLEMTASPAELCIYLFIYLALEMMASLHFKITEGGLGNNALDYRCFLLL